MSVGFIYVLSNESYKGLVKIGKTKKKSYERAKQLSGTGMLHPYIVIHSEWVSDCDAAEKRAHEELKQFREKQNREFFKVSSARAVQVIRRIAKEVNSQIPFPTPPLVIMPATPVRLYAVSFTCEGCGIYRSNTIERHAGKVNCPSCQHENNLNIAWS